MVFFAIQCGSEKVGLRATIDLYMYTLMSFINLGSKMMCGQELATSADHQQMDEAERALINATPSTLRQEMHMPYAKLEAVCISCTLPLVRSTICSVPTPPAARRRQPLR